MDSNEGAANIWKEAIVKAVISSGSAINTNGSAVIPQINYNAFQNVMTLEEKLGEIDSKSKEEIEDAKRDYLKFYLSQPKKIYKIQKIYGFFIFFFASVSLIAGLWFSYLQFSNAILINDLKNLQSEISIKTSGELIIKTSMIGGLILFFSLLFFFLFLKYVYIPHTPLIDPQKLFALIEKHES